MGRRLSPMGTWEIAPEGDRPAVHLGTSPSYASSDVDPQNLARRHPGAPVHPAKLTDEFLLWNWPRYAPGSPKFRAIM
jgi:hypothetical protein